MYSVANGQFARSHPHSAVSECDREPMLVTKLVTLLYNIQSLVQYIFGNIECSIFYVCQVRHEIGTKKCKPPLSSHQISYLILVNCHLLNAWKPLLHNFKVNRPGVAGAVLQTPSINSVTESSFVKISSKHLRSQIVKARDLTFFRKGSCVTCHMPHVTCHISSVIFFFLFSLFFFTTWWS